MRISPGAAACLEPRCHVDGVTRDERLGVVEIAGDHFARVEPGPRHERDARRAAELLVEPLQRLAHLHRGAHGAQRVVLVDARHAEDAHHRVADELLDDAAVPLEHRLHLLEVARHDAPQRLGVELLSELRRARDVREHDRHDLARLALGRGGVAERGSARWAEASVRIALRPACRTDQPHAHGRAHLLARTGRSGARSRCLRWSGAQTSFCAAAREMTSAAKRGSA